MGIYCDYSNTDFLHPPCTPVDQGQQGCAPLCTPPLNPPLGGRRFLNSSAIPSIFPWSNEEETHHPKKT